MSAAGLETPPTEENEVLEEELTLGEKTTDIFNDTYVLEKELGTGAFSTVQLGKHKQTNEEFAIKVVTKSEMQEFDKSSLKDEISVLKELDHEHIINLYDVFYEKDYIYLVMSLVQGGMLFERLVHKTRYSEKEAKGVFVILLEALEYCHRHGVAHRDLKPENLLLISPDDDSSIKIADFGFAKKETGPKSLKTQCGSPGHVAPEILKNVPYDSQVDMWSLGVIMYTLLGGYPPFYEPKRQDQFKKIVKGDYDFHEEWWSNTTSSAKDLIKAFLTVDPDERATAAKALTMDWIAGKNDDELAQHDLGASLERYEAFNAKRKLRGAISAIMATRKLSSLGIDFQADLQSDDCGDDESETFED